jgi:hypothetical protein
MALKDRIFAQHYRRANYQKRDEQMKFSISYLQSRKSVSAVVIALTWVSACKSMDFLKQKVENQSEFQASQSIESCGTFLSLGSVSGEMAKDVSLKVQAAVCGYIEGNDDSWQAIGLTVDTSEVLVTTTDHAAKIKSTVSIEGEKLFALFPDKKMMLGTVQGEVGLDASVKLLDQVSVQIMVEGRPYVAGSIDNKVMEKNLEVLFTVK